MRISDWSSDVCSSDLIVDQMAPQRQCGWRQYSGIASDVQRLDRGMRRVVPVLIGAGKMRREEARLPRSSRRSTDATPGPAIHPAFAAPGYGSTPMMAFPPLRSEEHTSELQSLMRTS